MLNSKRFFLLLLAFSLTACVTTNTTGFIDPDYKENGYRISKVVVQIEKATLDEIQRAEEELSAIFSAHGVEAIKYTDIAPPTRTYTPAEEATLLKKTGADSLFKIYASNEGRSVSETYVPLTYYPGTSTSTVNTIGNYSTVSTYSSPGFTTGGYSVSEPVMSNLFSLIDLSNGRQIWKAEAFSSGGSSFSDLIVHAGRDAIKNLQEKGLLPEIINEGAQTAKVNIPQKQD